MECHRTTNIQHDDRRRVANEGSPVTRISLLKLRPEVERDAAMGLWLGEHADVVRAIPDVRRYVVAVAEGARDRDQWDAIATLQFNTRAALDAALGDLATRRELARTREPFIESTDAFIVEEHIVIDHERT